ncbi:benzoate 4-monooxygenase cytochrome P450 [Westerdykella ornata]|uniref:Benzoate 4-monooxygenase cytochrome P450 n=1 Tax=Westerdykella ornata TaxID=318751 RepID=A0A6A6J6R1_WESOR|nr:benzoate 4-monooxygenase cytochrome P450 [Westerdykella ornata]KAF2272270.1 benzoate 4-monooxygenase cytochrome P450 [Westerdykella ornata]
MSDYIILALCLIVSYVFGSIVYSLFFHPLSKVPGPVLARINRLPSFYHALKGDRHVWIWQNFQLYGDKFRATPNLILFNNTRAFTDIYGVRANTRRSAFYKMWKRHANDVHTVNSVDKQEHAKKRRLLNLIFTERSVKAASPIIVGHIDRWIQLLVGEDAIEDGWSEPRNMSTWMDHLIFDIMGDLCFGQTFNTKEPGENSLKKMPHLILKQIYVGYILSKSPLFELLIFLQPRGLNKLMERARSTEVKQYNSFIESNVDDRIAAHKSSKSSRQDMFYFLLNATDPDTGLPAYSKRDHLLAEARALVLAGTDTTSFTLCGVLFYLAHNPRVLHKLQKEIRSTFASKEEIVHGTTLSSCSYLRACIDEALRLAPPAPGELPREVLSGGAIIGGQMYPAGTEVGCAAYAMGRLDDVFGDWNVYRPERWTPSTNADDFHTEADVRQLRKSFHPFSIGPLNCAGQNLATLELLLVIAKTTAGEGHPGLGWGQSSRSEFDGPVLQFRSRSDLPVST